MRVVRKYFRLLLLLGTVVTIIVVSWNTSKSLQSPANTISRDNPQGTLNKDGHNPQDSLHKDGHNPQNSLSRDGHNPQNNVSRDTGNMPHQPPPDVPPPSPLNPAAPGDASKPLSGVTKRGRQTYLLYVCVERSLCGGWSDRQRGLISVYLLSIVTERRFGIIMTKPYNITHFYVPNDTDVDWVIPDSQLQGRSNRTIIDVLMARKIEKDLKTKDFNSLFPEDVIYMTSNSECYWSNILLNPLYSEKIPSWARLGSVAQIFARAWTRIMRPTGEVQRQLDLHLAAINYTTRAQPLVCAHVRTWKGLNEIHHSVKKVETQNSHVDRVWAVVDRHVHSGSWVYVATDSYEIRNVSRARYGHRLLDTGGSIIHVDKSRTHGDEAREGFRYVVLDQLLLTHCDVLVVSSGYSERADFLRQQPEKDVYVYKGGEVEKYDPNASRCPA